MENDFEWAINWDWEFTSLESDFEWDLIFLENDFDFDLQDLEWDLRFERITEEEFQTLKTQLELQLANDKQERENQYVNDKQALEEEFQTMKTQLELQLANDKQERENQYVNDKEELTAQYSTKLNQFLLKQNSSLELLRNQKISIENEIRTIKENNLLLDGNIALAKRGDVNFFRKYLNANTAGAEGLIVFNNEPGLFQGTIINNLPVRAGIPIVAISQEDGEEILQTIENGMIISIIVEDQKDESSPLIIKGTITKKFWFVDLKTPFEIPNQCNLNPN